MVGEDFEKVPQCTLSLMGLVLLVSTFIQLAFMTIGMVVFLPGALQQNRFSNKENEKKEKFLSKKN